MALGASDKPTFNRCWPAGRANAIDEGHRVGRCAATQLRNRVRNRTSRLANLCLREVPDSLVTLFRERLASKVRFRTVCIETPAEGACLFRMKQSDRLRENAENCFQLAARKTDEPSIKRYQRMANAWLALAHQQDWLDGEVSPHDAAKAAGEPPDKGAVTRNG